MTLRFYLQLCLTLILLSICLNAENPIAFSGEITLHENGSILTTIDQLHIDASGVYIEYNGNLVLLSSIFFLSDGCIQAYPDYDDPPWFCRVCETYNDPGRIYCATCGTPYR